MAKPSFKPLSNPTAQAIFDDLISEGYSTQVTKREYADINKCSLSTIDHYMGKGYGLPPYRKVGGSRNAKVLFSLRDIVEFLAAQTVKTA